MKNHFPIMVYGCAGKQDKDFEVEHNIAVSLVNMQDDESV
jgi:hypothetical protein